MATYWGRVAGSALALLGLLGVQVAAAIGNLGSRPGLALIQFVVAPVIVVLVAGAFFLGWWVRGRHSRARRVSLSEHLGDMEWFADIQIDPDTVAALGSRDHRKSGVETEPRDYALLGREKALEIWADASDPGPRWRICYSDVSDIDSAPLGDVAVMAGRILLTIEEPHRELFVTLVGPFWGGYPPSPRKTSHFADQLGRAIGIPAYGLE